MDNKEFLEKREKSIKERIELKAGLFTDEQKTKVMSCTNEIQQAVREKLQTLLVATLDEYIAIVERFYIYDTFITEELLKQPAEIMDDFDPLNVFDILIKYREAYKIDEAPLKISRAEKSRLTKFINDYLQSDPAPIKPTGDLEKLKIIIPTNYIIPKNKLAIEMTRNFIDSGMIPLKVGGKKEILTYNSLTYEGEGLAITGRQTLTAYDRTVHNAVCSLWEAGNVVVTPERVYFTMNGVKDREYISPQTVGAVIKSLEKSRFINLKVDFTAEAKARNMDIEKATIDSNLLSAEVITIIQNGQERTAYKILKKPPLYEYAQLTKQVITVPLDLLDTRQATRSTICIIPIKEYLIRRIDHMKHDPSGTSNKIKYESIFDEVGIVTENATQLKRHRNNIKAILNLWKDKKYITNFADYKQGKTIRGLSIFF